MTLTFFDYEIPVLKALVDLGGSARPKLVYPLVEKLMSNALQNNPEDYGHYKSPKDIIWKNKTRWAREYLKRKGQLDGSVGGIWTITDAGKMRLEIFERTAKDPDEGKATLEGIRAELVDSGDKPEEAFDKIEKLHETGDILDIRGIVYEPINEQGVILLFAALCYDLDFRIEGIRTRFPDALLKRKNKRGRFSRCLAEFEYRSSDYKAHKHPLVGCDLIICWEHDWEECPIEVIELKTKVKEFK